MIIGFDADDTLCNEDGFQASHRAFEELLAEWVTPRRSTSSCSRPRRATAAVQLRGGAAVDDRDGVAVTASQVDAERISAISTSATC